MYYFRFDGNILDFTKGPATDRIMKMAENCFVRERKDRISIFDFKLTMTCPGTYMEDKLLDFYMVLNKKKHNLSCFNCWFGLEWKGKMCSVNSFLLPRHFHHRKINFTSLIAILNTYGYIQLPVPDPLTWGYINFRY
ncbi:hypothetical protein [Thermovenabulum gondwanense]|uniref:Uncharacterized protein n=1 Tax=Thermovenabulum gondwanense TaxID=520767 RepID=A0A161PWA3_9FIRM|nr:hypothetical protein [Thermovenabulum gondwanense]KYO67790.1 hypothetical protein ATZ99_04300 [Thermovenabulum gondwanense]